MQLREVQVSPKTASDAVTQNCAEFEENESSKYREAQRSHSRERRAVFRF